MPTSPSSRSTTKISELRSELVKLNQELLNLFQQRSYLVQQVQLSKPASVEKYPAYDAARESELFILLKQSLGAVSLREQYAFSLLMEAHALAPEKYPAWSEGAHLLEVPQHIEHRMNPLMLKVLYPNQFLALKLSPEFGFLRSI